MTVGDTGKRKERMGSGGRRRKITKNKTGRDNGEIAERKKDGQRENR